MYNDIVPRCNSSAFTRFYRKTQSLYCATTTTPRGFILVLRSRSISRNEVEGNLVSGGRGGGSRRRCRSVGVASSDRRREPGHGRWQEPRSHRIIVMPIWMSMLRPTRWYCATLRALAKAPRRRRTDHRRRLRGRRKRCRRLRPLSVMWMPVSHSHRFPEKQKSSVTRDASTHTIAIVVRNN